jgi:hypothetical protein
MKNLADHRPEMEFMDKPEVERMNKAERPFRFLALVRRIRQGTRNLRGLIALERLWTV